MGSRVPGWSSRTASAPSALRDLVLVLQDGSIVQRGTHDELLREDGLYARLAGHQGW